MKLSRNLVTWGKISLLMEFCRRVGNSIKKVGGVGKFFFFFLVFLLVLRSSTLARGFGD